MLKEDIIDFLMDKNWTKKTEILHHLQAKGHKICERKLRQKIRDFNAGYGTESYLFIAHSGRGYKLTYDKKLIQKSLNDQRKRALKMLKQYYDGLDAIGLENQVSLDLENDEKSLREIVMRGFKNG